MNYRKFLDGGFDSAWFEQCFDEVFATYSSEQKDGKLTITVDLPGFSKENVKVTVEPGYLRITAKNGKKSFNKSFILNTDSYLGNQAQAKLELGVLTITIPHAPQNKDTVEVVVQ